LAADNGLVLGNCLIAVVFTTPTVLGTLGGGAADGTAINNLG